jgi:hypothetical protein
MPRIIAGGRLASVHEHRGPAGAIAATIVAFTMVLGGVLVALGWLALTIYAIVKWIGSGSDEASATGLVFATVIAVTLLVGLLVAGIRLIGRPMIPGKRADRDAALV